MPSPRVLAVDSGAGHVACGVFTAAKSGRLTLDQLDIESFNPDSSIESQWSELSRQSLLAISSRIKLSGDMAVGIPGHHTLAKFVKTPAVEKAKRDRIIQFEAQQNIPYPLNEVVWGYDVVSDDGIDLEVMLSAVKLDVLESLCAGYKSLGLVPSSIIPSSLALCRAFRYNYPEITDNVMLLSIGARSTHLLFVEKDRYFVRTIALAGNSVTQSIADELKQDFAHAESLKLQVLSGSSDLPESSPARLAVASAISSFIGRLHLEITRSTVNYRRQSGAGQPTCIYLTGAGSLLPEIVEQLSEKVKLPVDRLDPLRQVQVGASVQGAEQYAPVLADLVGLAVPVTTSINLVPPAIGQARAFAKQQPFYVAAAALLVLGLALPIIQQNRLVSASKKKISDYNRLIQPLQTIEDTNKSNLTKIENAKKEIAALEGLVASKSNWINFLGDLQDRLVKVEDVWLERLQVIRMQRPGPGPIGGGNAMFGGPPPAQEDEASAGPAVDVLKLNLTGRLMDRHNPVSNVSPDSYRRVKELLASFVDSEFISAVEGESFDNRQQGILKFDFTLVVDPKHPL